MVRNAIPVRTASHSPRRSVRPRVLRSIHVIVAAAAMLSLGGRAEAGVWNLSDDFSLASNPNGAWTYELETTPGDDIEAYLPLDTNSRSATSLWGKTFPTAPTMWSEAGGYWGIGRNDTGVTQVSGDSAVTWAPGEVLFHPKNFTDVPTDRLRLVISWTAPVDTIIDVEWAYAQRATDGGDGVGLSVILDSSGSPVVLRPFFTNGDASGTFDALVVSAGDKLHFRFDNWGNAAGDITWTDITITSAPTPAALPAGLALMGAVGLRRRRIG